VCKEVEVKENELVCRLIMELDNEN
jgi:hypothetical protein